MDILNQNIVIVGDFNPAIIQPKWILSQKIYEGKIGLDINISNHSIRYFMEKTGIYWEIVGRHFISYNKNPLERLDKINLGFVKSIFSKLSYTPIQAIGHNINCRIPENDQLNSIFQNIELKRDKVLFSNFTNKYEFKDKTCTVQIEKQKNSYLIKFNFEKKVSSISISKEIGDFIDSLGDFYKYGNDFIKSI